MKINVSKFIFLIFGLIFFKMSPAFSEELPVSDYDKNIYQKSYNLCSNTDINSENVGKAFAIAMDSAREVYTEQRIFSLNKQLQEWLKSPWFFKALNSCYGNDNFKKLSFIAHLHIIDVEGKAIALLGIFKLAQILNESMKLIKIANATTYKVVQYVSNSIMVSSVVYSVYNQLFPPGVEELSSAMVETRDAISKMVLDEIAKAQDGLKVKLNNAKDSNEIAILRKKYLINECLRFNVLSARQIKDSPEVLCN